MHGKTCKVLSLIRLPDSLLCGAKYLLRQACLPFPEHPRYPANKPGMTARAAGTQPAPSTAAGNRAGACGRQRRGHGGKVKQGCNEAVDFGIALQREEVPVARP